MNDELSDKDHKEEKEDVSVEDAEEVWCDNAAFFDEREIAKWEIVADKIHWVRVLVRKAYVIIN